MASVDFVKQPEVLAGMDQIRWDLLVVDEAHLCAVAPERTAAVGALARRARRVVLLTAQPFSMDVIKAMSLGAHAYWPKPLTYQRAADGLRRALARV